jgi:hypothetical protein
MDHESLVELFKNRPVMAAEMLREVLGQATDQVLSSLHAAARRRLEEMMRSGYEFKSDFARTYVAKGELKGEIKAKANDVLAVLDARGLEIPADVRERVLACTDLAELDRWIRRAAVVSEARQLFEHTSS